MSTFETTKEDAGARGADEGRTTPPAPSAAQRGRTKAASPSVLLRASSLRRREALFVAGAILVFLLDQYTKFLAVSYLQPVGSVPLVGFLRLTYVENRGAAFGVLQNQTLFFILVGLVVVGGLVASYRWLPTVSPLLNLCLGLQLGGALGNLVDRVRQGYVVDFVDLTWWPVFNVADSAIVVGVCVMGYYLLWAPRPDERTNDA